MDNSTAWGIGLATITLDGTTLDTWYPAPHLGEAGTDEAVHQYQEVGTAGAVSTVIRWHDAIPVDYDILVEVI